MPEPLGYLLEAEDVKKLRGVSQELNDPSPLSFDRRRDMANLIDLIMSRAIPITS